MYPICLQTVEFDTKYYSWRINTTYGPICFKKEGPFWAIYTFNISKFKLFRLLNQIVLVSFSQLWKKLDNKEIIKVFKLNERSIYQFSGSIWFSTSLYVEIKFTPRSKKWNICCNCINNHFSNFKLYIYQRITKGKVFFL